MKEHKSNSLENKFVCLRLYLNSIYKRVCLSLFFLCFISLAGLILQLFELLVELLFPVSDDSVYSVLLGAHMREHILQLLLPHSLVAVEGSDPLLPVGCFKECRLERKQFVVVAIVIHAVFVAMRVAHVVDFLLERVKVKQHASDVGGH